MKISLRTIFGILLAAALALRFGFNFGSFSPYVVEGTDGYFMHVDTYTEHFYVMRGGVICRNSIKRFQQLPGTGMDNASFQRQQRRNALEMRSSIRLP